jgi:transcriptional regulator with XRE-family HTH domain
MTTTKKRRTATHSGGISGQLREIIHRRGLTAFSIARDAGLEASVVSRFLSRERGLTLASLDAIADAIGLRLVEKGRGRAGGVATKEPTITVMATVEPGSSEAAVEQPHV